MSKKNDIFVKHIENHLADMFCCDGIYREVCCKICGKTITQIYKEEEH